MKPRDKERLARCRPTLLRALDVVSVLPRLVQLKVYSAQEERDICEDARPKHRVTALLDRLEKKRSEDYAAFLDVLSEVAPNLYLMLTDDEFAENPSDMHESLTDGDSPLSRARSFLCAEVDAQELTSQLQSAGVLAQADVETIKRQRTPAQRTEALCDVLEGRGEAGWAALVEALSDTHPHVYLVLTGQDDLDDGQLDTDW